MNYELAKELKDAGFPQTTEKWLRKLDDSEPILLGCADCSTREIADVSAPTLEELIEACEDGFEHLSKRADGIRIEGWAAYGLIGVSSTTQKFYGLTPTEAVARLWLSLKNKLNA